MSLPAETGPGLVPSQVQATRKSQARGFSGSCRRALTNTSWARSRALLDIPDLPVKEPNQLLETGSVNLPPVNTHLVVPSPRLESRGSKTRTHPLPYTIPCMAVRSLYSLMTCQSPIALHTEGRNSTKKKARQRGNAGGPPQGYEWGEWEYSPPNQPPCLRIWTVPPKVSTSMRAEPVPSSKLNSFSFTRESLPLRRLA